MSGIDRRSALGIGAAGIAALNAGPLRARAAAPSLKAVVTVGGRIYEFREDSGQDLGDFVSAEGRFTQRCIRSEVAGFPLTVFFRPDRTSDRVEVVFELGRVFSEAPDNLGPYEVVILRGDQTLTRIDVPEHYWFARWRWQSSPRPVIADFQDLTRYGLLPPFQYSSLAEPPTANLNYMPLPNGDFVDLSVVAEFTAGNYANAKDLLITAERYQALTTGAGRLMAKLSTAQTTYSVMRLAGIQPDMTRAGERSDIGLVTEPQAQFIATGDQAALELLLSQAEAAGTMPWHIRDDRQDGPFNSRRYPDASWSDSAGAGTPHVKFARTPITLDSAHQPALAYVPYLLTADPYFLEELQFQATWNWGSLPAADRPTGAQVRAIAWNLRTLAQAARMTPLDTPLWLKPNKYWTQQLAEMRQWFETTYVFSPRLERQIFRTAGSIDDARAEEGAPDGTWVDPGQDDVLANVIGSVLFMGFGDWHTAFAWTVGGTIARTTPATGWVRAYATPDRMILRSNRDAPVASSWAEAWALTASIGKKHVVDPDAWAEEDMTYLTYTRGALVYAAKLGIPGAEEPLAWATAQLRARDWNVPAKWRLGLDVATL